jgi:hypothetical protein
VDVHAQPWTQWSTSKIPTVSPKTPARTEQPAMAQSRRARRATLSSALRSALRCAATGDA